MNAAREAAQRILDDDYVALSEGDDIADDMVIVARDVLSAPRWHAKPTGPGLWIIPAPRDFINPRLVRLSHEDIAEGRPFSEKPVYGPIPQCEETTC